MGHFRLATERDLDAVVGMMRRYYAEDGYTFVEADARTSLALLLSDPHLGRLWIAEEGGRVVGYLVVTLGFSLEYRGRDAFLDELYLEEGTRGRGYGGEALALAELYCREQGVRALHLEVERHRPAARKLYARAGFEEHDRHLMTKPID
jgi:GNAT superfamily N-acetyltransferase